MARKFAQVRAFAATDGWLSPLTILVVISSLLYTSQFAYRGWIPHDAGTFAQCAERVLEGEIPHRDFDGMYTGGLSVLHACAFEMLGTTVASMRTVLLVFSVFYCWTLHRIALRLWPPFAAALIAFSCVAWSIPNYFAAVPSWYNLFFAVFGISCLLAYVETSKYYWLWWTGFWGGVSIIFKIVGLYYVGGALFFIVFCALIDNKDAASSQQPWKWVMLLVAIAISAIWMTLVTLLIYRSLNGPALVHLLTPSLVVCTVLIAYSVRFPHSSLDHFVRFGRNFSILICGLTVPVAIFLIPFAMNGALGDLIEGVLIRPLVRLDGATYPFPSLDLLTLEIPLILFLALGFTRLGRHDNALLAGVIVCTALFVLVFPGFTGRELGLLIARMGLPFLAVSTGWILIDNRNALSSIRQRQLFLLLTFAAFTSLIQYPFAAPIYFCYVAPLQLLLFHFGLSLQRYAPSRTHHLTMAICLLFGALILNAYSFFDDPRMVHFDPPTADLELQRAGITVTMRDKTKYEQLIKTIQLHSEKGDNIFASPDCPEVYFLSDRRNPTRTLFELFDPPELNEVKKLRLMHEMDVKVVVINLEPAFSPQYPQGFVSEVKQRFSSSRIIENFLVCYDAK